MLSRSSLVTSHINSRKSELGEPAARLRQAECQSAVAFCAARWQHPLGVRWLATALFLPRLHDMDGAAASGGANSSPAVEQLPNRRLRTTLAPAPPVERHRVKCLYRTGTNVSGDKCPATAPTRLTFPQGTFVSYRAHQFRASVSRFYAIHNPVRIGPGQQASHLRSE